MTGATPGGRQVHYGIREHGMGSIMVGMALHGGVLPAGGTFFVFLDYMRPPVRLAALSGAKVVFVFTHDSVGVGEDGPTHQPVEHVATLRAIPDLQVIRPADANETVAAWRAAVEHHGPTALVLSRQNITVCTDGSAVATGAGVVLDADAPQIVLIATGSEVSLCVEAAGELATTGVRGTRRSAFPPGTASRHRAAAYRASVLPAGCPGAERRGGRHLRVGALGGRLDRHRPLRRQRSGRHRARQARHQRRPRRGSRHGTGHLERMT